MRTLANHIFTSVTAMGELWKMILNQAQDVSRGTGQGRREGSRSEQRQPRLRVAVTKQLGCSPGFRLGSAVFADTWRLP